MIIYQYSEAIEFPYSNVCSTNGPGNFLFTKKMLGQQFIFRSSYKQLIWSIYVYFIYGIMPPRRIGGKLYQFMYTISIQFNCFIQNDILSMGPPWMINFRIWAGW